MTVALICHKEDVMPDARILNPRQNRILAALPVADFARLADDLELVTFSPGEVVYASGDSLSYAYFPVTCIVSLTFSTEDGASMELAMTGSDGLVGVPLVLGGETSPHTVIVQNGGTAFRLRAEMVRWEFDQGGNLLRLTLGYVQALMTQMAQSIVCNRHHRVDQQLCRWLLLSIDLLPSNQLDVTQEQIARVLGVRREAVTEAAGNLQVAGLIKYQRGHITVTDRSGLEMRVCECYSVVKSEYNRLFSMMPTDLVRQRGRPNRVSLRKRAEAKLRQVQLSTPNPSWDAARLLYELQVHQIELELHNEELREAYEEADLLRR